MRHNITAESWGVEGAHTHDTHTHIFHVKDYLCHYNISL